MPELKDLINDVFESNKSNEKKTEEILELFSVYSRKPLDRIVERLEEERVSLKKEREEAIEYDDEQIIFATNNQIRAFDYSLRIIKEEGGMND